MIIDCELSWKGHADHIIKKINKNIFVFKKIKTLLTKTTRQLFCTAFILPHISYCCNILGHYPETHKIAINRLLKQCARLILNKNISYPSHELFSTLKWLTLENKVQFETAVITYKSLNHLAPAYLTNCLTHSANTSLRSNSNGNLQLPTVHKEIFRKSFSYSSSKIWNSLSTNTKHSPTLYSFKSNVYKDLFNHA